MNYVVYKAKSVADLFRPAIAPTCLCVVASMAVSCMLAELIGVPFENHFSFLLCQIGAWVVGLAIFSNWDLFDRAELGFTTAVSLSLGALALATASDDIFMVIMQTPGQLAVGAFITWVTITIQVKLSD